MDDRPDDILARAAVTARGVVSGRLAEIEMLRSRPSVGNQRPSVAKSLRNADEQTVAAVAAMLRAIDSLGWRDESFREWGVIGCPRFLGRMIISGVITRFLGDPKYSINPHIIPNYSLHSLSGAASMGLEMHGPNFGVGGGPGNVSEGLMTALSVMAEGRVPGLWLLLAEFDPEPIPDRTGKPRNDVNVHAVALALQRTGGVGAELRLTSRPTSAAPPTVRELAKYLSAPGAKAWTCPVPGLGSLELAIPAQPGGAA